MMSVSRKARIRIGMLYLLKISTRASARPVSLMTCPKTPPAPTTRITLPTLSVSWSMSFMTVPLDARYLRRQKPVSSMAKNRAMAPLLTKERNSYTGPSVMKRTPMAPAQMRTAGKRIRATTRPAEGALGLRASSSSSVRAEAASSSLDCSSSSSMEKPMRLPRGVLSSQPHSRLATMPRMQP